MYALKVKTPYHVRVEIIKNKKDAAKTPRRKRKFINRISTSFQILLPFQSFL